MQSRQHRPAQPREEQDDDMMIGRRRCSAVTYRCGRMVPADQRWTRAPVRTKRTVSVPCIRARSGGQMPVIDNIRCCTRTCVLYIAILQ